MLTLAGETDLIEELQGDQILWCKSLLCDAANSPCDVTVGRMLQEFTWRSGTAVGPVTELFVLCCSSVLCYASVSSLGPLTQWRFLWCRCVFCEAAVYSVMQQREGILTQQWALEESTALSDGVLDFLNGFGSSYQSMYVKMLKQITPNPLSVLDYYPNV